VNNTDLSKLCVPLRDLLQHEISRGNSIKAVETGWSKVSLAVRLTQPLDLDYAKTLAQNDPDLEIWESRDIKYPIEAGVLCKSAKQTLSGSIANK
jgi:hypothetical protein